MQIKCAVFDLDGTLLNTIKTINHYLNFALSSYDLPPVSESDTMSFVGDGAVKLIERAISRVDADTKLFDGIYKTYNDAYNASPFFLTEAYDGIKECIASLKRKGIKLAVLSNKPDFAVKATVSKYFPESFDAVRGGREGIPLKPCPDALLEIINEMKVAQAETVYIGDSEQDVFTAKNAGVLSVGVTWGFAGEAAFDLAAPDVVVTSPEQLLGIIE